LVGLLGERGKERPRNGPIFLGCPAYLEKGGGLDVKKPELISFSHLFFIQIYVYEYVYAKIMGIQ
jgi:hypothetical protein